MSLPSGGSSSEGVDLYMRFCNYACSSKQTQFVATPHQLFFIFKLLACQKLAAPRSVLCNAARYLQTKECTASKKGVSVPHVNLEQFFGISIAKMYCHATYPIHTKVCVYM